MDELPEVPNNFPRITPRQIGLDIIAILNFDRGVLFTIKGLILSPYTTMQSYLQGDRRKHAHPIRMLVFSSALAAFLTINLVGITDANVSVSDSDLTAEDGTVLDTEKAAEFQNSKEEAVLKVKKDINNFMEKYLNLFFIGSVPIISLLCWGFYWRKGYNVAEHLVINCFLASIGNTFSIIFATLTAFWEPAMAIGMFLAMIYYVYAMMDVYRNNSFWGFLKTIFLLFLYTAIVLAMTLGGMFLFVIYWGEEYGITNF